MQNTYATASIKGDISSPNINGTAYFYPYKDDIYMFLVDKLPDKDLERMNVLKENNKDSKSSNSNLDEIKKLKELLDMGAITKEEFEKKKKELLK